MQQLDSIEKSLVNIYKDLPHFPKGLKDWLADNAWWLVVIGVVLGAWTIMSILFATALVGTFLVGYVGGVAGVAAGGALTLTVIISIATLAATVVIEAMAIQPLKHKQRRGWQLLLLASLVSFAGSALASVLRVDIASLFGLALGTAIGLYILFELRDHFVAAKPAPAKK